MIAAIYILGTFAVLSMIPASDVDPKSGVYQAITHGSTALRIGFFGVMAALLVSVGNAGGVEARSRESHGCHLLWESTATCQPRLENSSAVEDALRLDHRAGTGVRRGIAHQPNQRDHARAYQVLVDITILIYFIPFLYMFAAVIKLAKRKDGGK